MIKNILFDFDGVILDSMPVREYGFRKIFESYDKALVDQLLAYHNQNGGLSRYVKIRYFYEKLLHKSVQDEEIAILAEKFSVIMKNELIKKTYLIDDSLSFIAKNHKKYNLHIVSGSDERELRFLCKKLEVDKYFLSINGSPVHKNDLVKKVMAENTYKEDESILIGDSINDYEAAKVNNIRFYGYNNNELRSVSHIYLDDYEELR